MPEEVQFRPSLIIGLGGTGKEVVLNLKERFARSFDQSLSLVRFLVADTTLATEDRSLAAGEERIQLAPQEFYYLGNVEANEIVDNLNKPGFESIKLWFPARLRPGMIDRGAAMTRAIGRLALFWHATGVSGAINAAVHELMRIANIPLGGGALAAAQEWGINVFLVTSVCGGTGSGIFLDVAYMVRDTLRQVGLLDVSKVTGTLVMPGAFPRASDQENLQANAYAALKELDYFMETAEFRCTYSDTPPYVVEIHRRPFDLCYLIDTINENRKKLTDIRGVAELIAEAFFLFITSDTGKKLEDLEINIRDRVLQFSPPPTNKPAAYSSFGTSSLVLPTRRIRQACTFTLAANLIEEGLLRPVEDVEALETQVKQFIDTHELSEDPADHVVDALMRDDRGRRMSVSLDAVDLFATPGPEVQAEARAFVETYRREHLARFENLLQANADRLEKEKIAVIEQQVEALVNDPERGLLYADRWLEALNRAFDHFWSLMKQEQEQQEKLRASAEKSLEGLWETLDAAVNSFVLFRKRKIQDALEMTINTVGDLYRKQLDAQSRSLAVRFYAALILRVSALRSELDQLRVRLKALAERYRAQRRQMESFKETGDFVLERSLITEEDIDSFYNERVTHLRDEVAQLLQHPRHGRVYGWRLQSDREIEEHLQGYCEEKFAGLESQHLDGPDGVMVQKGMNPDRILDRLMTFAVPFWNYSEVRARGLSVATVDVVGVEDEATSLIARAVERRPGETATATTKEPDRITVTRARHGLPLFALTMIDNWKRSYDSFLRAGRRPVHVLKDGEELPEPVPDAGGDRARMIFAVAMAYGFIDKVGPTYCVVADDRTQVGEFVELAEDRRDAENVFVRDQNLVEKVGDRITQRNRELGNVEIKARLQQYLATLEPRPGQERQMEKERKRIEAYLEGLEA